MAFSYHIATHCQEQYLAQAVYLAEASTDKWEFGVPLNYE